MKRVPFLEAVSVCVGYHDFLQQIAPFNIPLLDNWLIVTTPQDTATREVCRRFNLSCLLSEEGTRSGKFSKGHLVERGLQHLREDSWRLHIDADIALPHRFRHCLEIADLQADTIYGIDRVMVRSWSEWQSIKRSDYLSGGQYDYHCRVNVPHGFNLGTRWAHPEMGYVPIGFFQLWHASQDEWRGIRAKAYPSNHGSACRSDVQHGLQWDRAKRAIIPEIIGVHLESEPAKKGANWAGRTTRPFGPPTSDIKEAIGS